MGRIAKRYAKALFTLASGDLAKAKKQGEALNALKELFDDPKAGPVLRSPVMPPELKKALLDYGLSQVAADDGVKKTVQTVLESGRVTLLLEVAKAYNEYIDEAEGVVRAQMASAVPLPPADQQHIAEALGQILKKKVDITAATDPSLLGGFAVNVGNYRIDLSLRTKLDGLATSAVQDSIR
jgi:F-type H+-transporting ATPase subunit delta